METRHSQGEGSQRVDCTGHDRWAQGRQRKDGAVVDVEWNPKDGNLDRDFGNYTTLHDTGLIDVGYS